MRSWWTADASEDLLAIADYLSDRDSAAASRFVDLAEATASLLERFPRSGRPLAGARDVRTMAFGRWILIYRVEEDLVRVLRVVDGSRDVAAIVKRLDA